MEEELIAGHVDICSVQGLISAASVSVSLSTTFNLLHFNVYR